MDIKFHRLLFYNITFINSHKFSGLRLTYGKIYSELKSKNKFQLIRTNETPD